MKSETRTRISNVEMLMGNRSTGEQPVRVVASVIRRGASFLVCRRPLNKRHGGLWEFPGGKVREGETVQEAVRRELMEELQIDVTDIGESLFAAEDPDTSFIIEFIEVKISGEPRAIEHSEVRWRSAVELISLALAPADDRFVRERLGRQGSSVRIR